MLTPKRTKYRKVQKGILKGKAQRGTQVQMENTEFKL